MTDLVQAIIGMFIAATGYIFLTTIVGATHARIASWFGEYMPRYYGMTEFNPIHHIDPFGFIFFVLFNVGWKKELPLSPDTAASLNKRLKIYVVEPILYTLCAFILSCTLLIITRQPSMLMLRKVAAIHLLAPNYSPAMAMFVHVLQTFVLLAISLAITAIFFSGLQIVINMLTYNTFGEVRTSLTANLTLAKLAILGLGFAAFYFTVPLLFRPLLTIVYVASHALIGLILPLT